MKEVKIPKQVQAMIDAAEATVVKPDALPAAESVAAEQPAAAAAVETPAVEIPPADPHAGTAQRMSYEQIVTLPHEKLAQMYSTLQGKYHAEVQPLAQRVRELESENEQLKLRPVSVPARPFSEELDDDTREEVGPEVLTVVQKMEDRLRSEFAAEKFESFIHTMDALVPDFRKHNEDPEFIAWLAGKDPLAAEPRSSGFQKAVSRMYAPIAAQYFQTWLASKQPPAVPSMKEVSVPENAGGAGKPSDSKPLIKESFITEFDSDVVKGRYRNDPAEQSRIEQMINAAVREGRVTRG